MIGKPKYGLNCKVWGTNVGVEITGIRCCEICHTYLTEKGKKGHNITDGYRGYRKMPYKHETLTMLVCCGMQNICLKKSKQEALWNQQDGLSWKLYSLVQQVG